MRRSSPYIVRWMMIIGASALLPSFIMRCDRMALNTQRGFFQGLGFHLSGELVDEVF